MSSPASSDAQWFGHPRGLFTLFMTEVGERFSFYGMKAMLFLFVTAAVMDGGLGITESVGGAIVGLYNSGVYLLALPGGWMADRLIGQRRAVLYGGIIIAAGHFTLAIPALWSFYLGLVLIVIGTGLLKPNISTMVGELYEGDDGSRRDAAFSIFYMGINLGGFLGPLACGYLRQRFGWHAGFGAAGVVMTLGILWYIFDGKRLGHAGVEPKSPPESRARSWRLFLGACAGTVALALLLVALDSSGALALTWTGVADTVGYLTLIAVALFLGYVAFFTGLDWVAQKKVIMIGILFVFTAMFWSGFEQASTSLNAFARDMTDRVIFGFEMPTEYLQSVNSLFIIILSPFFAALWIRLSARNLNPSIPVKFALGLIQLGIGFFVLMVAAGIAAGAGGAGIDGKVLPTWLCVTYLFFTTGELCLSPVGLSTITKLAPPQFASQMMGIWFIAAALGNLIAGRVGGMIENLPHATIFRTVGLIAAAAGVLLLVLSPMLQKRFMGGVR